jgi:hypothetical protein
VFVYYRIWFIRTNSVGGIKNHEIINALLLTVSALVGNISLTLADFSQLITIQFSKDFFINIDMSRHLTGVVSIPSTSSKRNISTWNEHPVWEMWHVSTNWIIILPAHSICRNKTQYYLQHNDIKRMDFVSREIGITASAALFDVTPNYLRQIK